MITDNHNILEIKLRIKKIENQFQLFYKKINHIDWDNPYREEINKKMDILENELEKLELTRRNYSKN